MLTTVKPNSDMVFEIIIPSLPGFGFSSSAFRPGLGAAEISVMLKDLMLRLKISEFYVHGGDWGSYVTTGLAVLFPEHIIGVHTNTCNIQASLRSMCLTLLATYVPTLFADDGNDARMSASMEKYDKYMEKFQKFWKTEHETIEKISDSPREFLKFMLEQLSCLMHPSDERIMHKDGVLSEIFDDDDILDMAMIFWVTSTIESSGRIYTEHFDKSGIDILKFPITVPVACLNMPRSIMPYYSRTILREKYANLVQFSHASRGGHFAAFSEPELVSRNLREVVRKNEPIVLEAMRLINEIPRSVQWLRIKKTTNILCAGAY